MKISNIAFVRRRGRSPAMAVARMRAATALAGALTLSACATFSPHGGLEPVTAFASQELGKDVAAIRTDEDAQAARRAVERLLRRPLSADAAAQVALLNNRGLQAAFNELGIAEAAMVGASLPPNPTVSLSRLAGAGEIEIERKIIGNILALATLPVRADLASQRFRQAQLHAIAETVRTAVAARRAWYRTVAADEIGAFLASAQDAAKSAALLARRLGESGALNKLDQAREQVFYADITAQAALARRRASSERERLNRALGLWGADLEFRLARRLPALPARARTSPAVASEAVRRRVDIQIARIEVELLAKSYGLTQATRFVSLLEAAAIAKKTTAPDGETVRERGIEVEFQVPLFDFGAVRVREAEQSYMAAVNRLIEKAVNARSQARDAYRVYRASYDIAAHYQHEVLPLRRIISEETLLRYNAMQIDVFALLAEARQRIAAAVSAIEARRDFWLAETNLSVAILGGAPGDAAGESISMAAVAGGDRAGH
jgi:outer membrane protein TolC